MGDQYVIWAHEFHQVMLQEAGLPSPSTWDKGWKMSSVKDQKVSIWEFVSHTVSAATTQLCCCSAKAAIDDTANEHRDPINFVSKNKQCPGLAG